MGFNILTNSQTKYLGMSPQEFYEEFKKAIVRSSGGVSRAGFLS